MTNNEVLNHWRYFLALENDLISTQNYIEIHKDNFKTFSFEYSKILQLSCAEIDSILKILCQLIDKDGYSKLKNYEKNISKYKEIILNKYPKLVETEIFLSSYGLSCKAWMDLSDKVPSWWTSYNKVKHNRHENFNKANLENVLSSLSGLLVLNLYLNRMVNDTPFSQPSLETSFFKCKYMSSSLRCRADNPLPDFEDDFEKIKK